MYGCFKSLAVPLVTNSCQFILLLFTSPTIEGSFTNKLPFAIAQSETSVIKWRFGLGGSSIFEGTRHFGQKVSFGSGETMGVYSIILF